MIQIKQLPLNVLEQHKPHMLKFFGKALEDLYPEHNEETLFDAISKKKLGALVIADLDKPKIYGYTIFQLNIYPTGLRSIQVHLVGGIEMNKWLRAYLETLENIAKVNQCNFIIASGRSGWSRILEKFGYESDNIPSVAKNLTDVAEGNTV